MTGRCKTGVVFVVLAVLLAAVHPAAAQAPDDAWGAPVNLSRSGAASHPQVVAAPDGRAQAFWWDQFDGLMTASFDGEAWSAPSPAPILATILASDGQVIQTRVEVMPTIVADGRGFAYALWVGDQDEETGARPLLRSHLVIGGTSWTSPEIVAEAAVAFEAQQSPGGGLVLAYVRPAHSDQFPAGVYIKTTRGAGGEWSPPANVYGTIYFRRLTSDATHLRIGVGSIGAVHLAWQDPYRGAALYANSTDGGATWNEPKRLGRTEDAPTRPRAFALAGGGALRMWEAAGLGTCTLHQQRLEESNGGTPSWGTPQPVLEGLASCPQGAESISQRDGSLIWLWGQGTGALGLAGWDAPSARWSEPRSFAVGFDDPLVPHHVALEDLHATLVGDALTIVGLDPLGGDIWSLAGEAPAWDIAFSSPSPWSVPVRISEEGVVAASPAVTLDAEGNAHIVWSQSTTADEPGNAIVYVRWDAASGRLSRAVEILGAPANEELARQPALVADTTGLLHLVWSGNAEGQIVYSRARTEDAGAPGGWSSPLSLPMPARTGSRPQIAVDEDGGLLVAYAVPLNEARGIYLVRSSDRGETWTDLRGVFSAETAGWPMVDQPTLAVAPTGGLHVAWIKGALPGTWPPQAIYHSLSPEGASWSEPGRATEAGAEWPRLVVAGGQVHLLYTDTALGVWHRSAALDQAGELATWSTPTRVQGFGEVDGPFGAAADVSGIVHVVGGTSDTGTLLYSRWEGESWVAAKGPYLGPAVRGVLGASSAASPGSDRLVVAVEALIESAVESEDVAAPAILFTQGEVGSTAVSPQATPAPAEEAVTTEEPVSGTVAPLPTAATLDLGGGAPPDTSASQLPLFAGVGLAAVAVLALVGAWAVWSRRQ